MSERAEPEPAGPVPGGPPAAPAPPVADGSPGGPADTGHPEPRRARRGRTPLLVAGAAVLGLIAGTCAGYLVQAGRGPTPLPPLSQPDLARGTGKPPEPLSAAQDHRVRTDGDLRRLLLPKPADARADDLAPGTDGWLDLTQLAETYNQPARGYGWQLSREFRRAAVTAWRENGTRTVRIRLLQYRQEEVLGASDAAEDAYYWAAIGDDTDSWPVPGTGDGMAYVHTAPEHDFDAKVYSAEAHAWRGDIAMQIYVYDTEPVAKKTILGLAERQMERL
ncbi:hypothetical protein [Streptomyces sp. SID486]